MILIFSYDKKNLFCLDDWKNEEKVSFRVERKMIWFQEHASRTNVCVMLTSILSEEWNIFMSNTPFGQ